MLISLRGVGKTVLLDRMRQDAELAGIHTVRIEPKFPVSHQFLMAANSASG
jgi:hypothetical protein